ncbi:MAG: ubiquinol oxidase subunit II [Neorhizobium sp.]|nr:ubiquinol oxidase subunit II [Neorhizobium sp.]
MLKRLCQLSLAATIPFLSGCDMVVMSPSGDIAIQQRDLIIVSTILMLLIIVPVIFLTLYFAWHYRGSNTSAKYDPNWHHSTRLEVVIWAAPLAIIIALGAITWISTHQLDPYRPLDRIAEGRPVTAETKPLRVQVVALDWKWLFFYPDLGIATVNELAAPVDTPINFEITATSVMNSFYVPALAGQIYAMPGMNTKLHAVINHAGEYEGFSANFSGPGFSHMRFKFHGLDKAGFDQWVATVKQNGTALNTDAYLKLEKPTQKVPVTYYASADQDLYHRILNMCAEPGKMCMDEMMHIDMTGGAGKESHENMERLKYKAAPIDEYGAPHGPSLNDAPAAESSMNTGAPQKEAMATTSGMADMPGMSHGDAHGAAAHSKN